MSRGFRCCSTAAAPTLTFEDEQTATLRTELGALSFTALQRRAAERGLGQGDIDTALDSSDEPKAALIAALLDNATAKDLAMVSKRRELERHRLMELHRRATAEGVDAAALDEAMVLRGG